VVRAHHEATAGREVLSAPPVTTGEHHHERTQEGGDATV
jgi:hypothetical protein